MESLDTTTLDGFWAEMWLRLGGFGLFSLIILWFVIDAVRRREWLWVIALIALPGVAAFWYFFSVYRGSSVSSGFELPGAYSRKRIRELQALIHNLDKAHHHSELGDIYFQKGKLDQAEVCYRASLERDPNDLDTRAHLGQCLIRQKRAAEAKPLLQGVLRENPKHDYNHTAMAYAETLAALGETDAAIQSWEYVVANNSYPRAKVQLAELYLAKNQSEPARAQLKDVLADAPHTASFQRRRDRVWVRRARSLMRKITG
ncbi:MAG: tetratricopeptide repeat protein [Verrucomicrobia bacterium]|nr:tetratricopeptide repeat protein [Verrucomicrobiota bacterium]